MLVVIAVALRHGLICGGVLVDRLVRYRRTGRLEVGNQRRVAKMVEHALRL